MSTRSKEHFGSAHVRSFNVGSSSLDRQRRGLSLAEFAQSPLGLICLIFGGGLLSVPFLLAIRNSNASSAPTVIYPPAPVQPVAPAVTVMPVPYVVPMPMMPMAMPIMPAMPYAAPAAPYAPAPTAPYQPAPAPVAPAPVQPQAYQQPPASQEQVVYFRLNDGQIMPVVGDGGRPYTSWPCARSLAKEQGTTVEQLPVLPRELIQAATVTSPSGNVFTAFGEGADWQNWTAIRKAVQFEGVQPGQFQVAMQ